MITNLGKDIDVSYHFSVLPHLIMHCLVHNVETSKDSSFSPSLSSSIDPSPFACCDFSSLSPLSFFPPLCLFNRQRLLMIWLTQSVPSSLTRAPTLKKCVCVLLKHCLQLQMNHRAESLSPLPISPFRQTKLC